MPFRSEILSHIPGTGELKLDSSWTEAYCYEPRTLTSDDWEKAAITCPVCGQPTARLLSYGFLDKRKVCPRCIKRRARLLEYKARLFEARRRGRQPGAGWACAGYADLPQAEILGK